MVKLTEKVKDTITGIEGTAVSRTQHVTGCVQIGVMLPQPDASKVPEEVYISEDNLEPNDGEKPALHPLLGKLVMDSITSYSGIVLTVTSYIASDSRAVVQKRELDKDGNPHKVQAFDVHRLTVQGVNVQPEYEKKPGGPNRTPPPLRTP